MTVEHPFNKIVEGIGVSDIRQFDAEVSSIPGIIKLTLENQTLTHLSILKRRLSKRLKTTTLTTHQTQGFLN